MIARLLAGSLAFATGDAALAQLAPPDLQPKFTSAPVGAGTAH